MIVNMETWIIFWEFLKIGLFSFGGAYGAIPLIQECVLRRNWADEAMLANMLAISESTPGPIMVNAATFIGNLRGGFWGAVLATIGVVLPAFVILLLIAAILKRWMERNWVKNLMSGITPCVMGVILATGIHMAYGMVRTREGIDGTACIILLILIGLELGNCKLLKRKLSPILLILFAAVLGIVLY